LLLPVLVGLGWQVWLEHVWSAQLPMLSGADENSSVPVIGIARSFLDGLVTGSVTNRGLGASYLIERVALVGLVLTALWCLSTGRAGVRLGEAAAWVAAVALAFTLGGWVNDVQFLRATYEAWALSIVVLVSSRGRVVDRVLIAAGCVSAGVTLLYLIRV
jgi:hypothetical protein